MAVTTAVSIIVPCYDLERYIGRTIESVLAQTFDSWELIVVDDGSPGDVEAAIMAYRAHPRITLVRKSNGGPCSARNFGFDNCSPRSQYLLFLDADDILEQDMLRILVGYLDAHTDVGMAFCDRTLIDTEDRPIPRYRDDWIRRYVPDRSGVRLLQPDEPETPFQSIFAYNITVPSVTLLRRSTYVAASGWDERLGPIYDDTDLYLRITLRSHAHYLPQKLVRRRLHDRSGTRSLVADNRRREATRRFDSKWKTGIWLTGPQRKIVADARRFKQTRLLPYLWVSWSRERVRQRQFVEAAKYCMRACWIFARGWI